MPSLDQAPLDQAAEVAKINQNQVQQEEAQLVETNNNDPLLPKSNIAWHMVFWEKATSGAC